MATVLTFPPPDRPDAHEEREQKGKVEKHLKKD